MKRLTDREVTGDAFYPKCFERTGCYGEGGDCANCKFSDKVCEKLAAYEDLGYEPEELKEKIEKYENALQKIATRKMSEYLTSSHMSNDFIKIAISALE